MHLDREQVERALDGGLRTEPEMERHLESCPECQARLDQARREEAWIHERLGMLDHAPPPVSARSVMTRRKQTRRGWERLAAGIFLAVAAAGAAYAAPGSPLPGLIRRVVDQIAATPSPQQAPNLPAARGSQAGIAVVPGARLTIEFATPQPGDTAVVSLSDTSEVTVRATGGKTTFVSETDRLVVRQSGAAARFEILIPQDAPWISLAVGQRRLWRKTGARIDAMHSFGGPGRYVLPLSQPPPSPAP